MPRGRVDRRGRARRRHDSRERACALHRDDPRRLLRLLLPRPLGERRRRPRLSRGTPRTPRPPPSAPRARGGPRASRGPAPPRSPRGASRRPSTFAEVSGIGPPPAEPHERPVDPLGGDRAPGLRKALSRRQLDERALSRERWSGTATASPRRRGGPGGPPGAPEGRPSRRSAAGRGGATFRRPMPGAANATSATAIASPDLARTAPLLTLSGMTPSSANRRRF